MLALRLIPVPVLSFRISLNHRRDDSLVEFECENSDNRLWTASLSSSPL